MGFSKSSQKMVADARDRCAGAVRIPHCIQPGFGCCALYLHVILKITEEQVKMEFLKKHLALLIIAVVIAVGSFNVKPTP